MLACYQTEGECDSLTHLPFCTGYFEGAISKQLGGKEFSRLYSSQPRGWLRFKFVDSMKDFIRPSNPPHFCSLEILGAPWLEIGRNFVIGQHPCSTLTLINLYPAQAK